MKTVQNRPGTKLHKKCQKNTKPDGTGSKLYKTYTKHDKKHTKSDINRENSKYPGAPGP